MSRLFEYLSTLPFPDAGRMYGYLIGQDVSGHFHELWAFSGAAAPEVDLTAFAPLPCDVRALSSEFVRGEAKVVALTERIAMVEEGERLSEFRQSLSAIRRQAKREIEDQEAVNARRKAARDAIRRQAKGSNTQKLTNESQFDRARLRELKQLWKARIAQVEREVSDVEDELHVLRHQRAELSAQLQTFWFEHFTVCNAKGEERSLASIFSEQGLGLPPSGTGECAAPKLLAEAYRRNLNAVSIQEFWWGPSPNVELRRHRQTYAPCRGRCQPLLSFMLKGTEITPGFEPPHPVCTEGLEVLRETADYVVVHKPHGLLSVPGKVHADSVLVRVKERFSHAQGPMIVHRLDQATSGIMVVALTWPAYHHLQRQFLERTVEKRYSALLEGRLTAEEGRIELPLRPDVFDRPRQVVDVTLGKHAVTRWRRLREAGGRTWVNFWPETGRTHQLRVHAAHQEGLNTPIVGDPLYGQANGRLMLFAEALAFDDPATGERIAHHLTNKMIE